MTLGRDLLGILVESATGDHDLYEGEGAFLYDLVTRSDRSELSHVARLARDVDDRETILDLASGAGRLVHAMSASGARIRGLDSSTELLRRFEEVFSGEARISSELVDLNQWAPEPDSAALVTFGAGSIRLFDAAGRAAIHRSVRRALRPDGRYYVSNLEVPPGAGSASPMGDVETVSGEPPRSVVFCAGPDSARGGQVTGFVVMDRTSGEIRTYSSSVLFLETADLIADVERAGFELLDRRRSPVPGAGGPVVRQDGLVFRAL